MTRLTLAAAWLVLGVCSACAQWADPVLLPPEINNAYYSTISADGQVLCLTILGATTDDDVYITEKLSDSTWSAPVNAGPNVNDITRNLSPSITNDRQRLYYVSWTGTTYRIFVSRRTGPSWSDWSPGEALPAPIHRGNEFTAQIGYDDSTLIYTSTYRPDSVLIFGDYVMYTTRLQPDGLWSEPRLLAPHVVYMNGACHPCLTDSGRTLVYGQPTGLQSNVYYAFRNDTGFSAAIACDSSINSPFWDSSPSCPVDGSVLYFDSQRPLDSSHVDGVPHLYVARRVPLTTLTPKPIHSKHASMQIVPSFGSLDTQFTITLPDPMKGQPVQVMNLLGQLVETLVPADPWDTNLLWNGASHATHVLSSGPYFFVATCAHQTAVGRITILR